MFHDLNVRRRFFFPLISLLLLSFLPIASFSSIAQCRNLAATFVSWAKWGGYECAVIAINGVTCPINNDNSYCQTQGCASPKALGVKKSQLTKGAKLALTGSVSSTDDHLVCEYAPPSNLNNLALSVLMNYISYNGNQTR